MLDWKASYATIRQAQEPALAAQLASVWERSPFYRERWGSKPDPARFDELPLIAKTDLHQALERGFLGSNRACSAEDLVHIHASSGTSGRPTYFGLTGRDYDAWMRTFVRGFELAGVKGGDRVLHGFAMSRGYAGAVPMVEAFEAMGCVALAMGAEAGSVRLVDAVERLEPRVLYASPSMARRLAAAFAEETGRSAAESAISLVLTGGEPGAGDPASKRQLADAWGAEVRECGGGTDVCPLMVVECAAHDGLHFIAGDDVLFELVDPESGRRVPMQGRVEGEIVYTHLFRHANPVVRMRHGDVVEIETAPCSCGLEAPRLWFRGRSDDMLIVRGVKLFPSSIQSVVSQFSPGLTGMFAIRQPRREVTDEALRVVCECSLDGIAAETLRSTFEERARQALGVRVQCELVPEDTIGRDTSGKVKWMITDD
jgi:phenylacetate-CoA ligase